jgi:putative flippase GtrA
MYLLTRRLEVQYLLSQILTTGIVLGWNFTANHRWSFKDSRSAEGGAA